MSTNNTYRINGGKRLFGSVSNQNAKNAILPIMAASLICSGETILHDCPNLTDIDNMILLIEKLGIKVSREGNDLIINTQEIICDNIDETISARFRSSIFLLGAMLARCRHVCISKPGGCSIGERSIDLHLSSMEKLGVRIHNDSRQIVCDGKDMHAGTIYLTYPSVGATENIIMASVLLKGKTRIINAACEPEIVDLQNFLNKCGANICGAGTSFITINGVDKLHATQYVSIPDRIVAGTYLCFGAMNNGRIRIDNVDCQHIDLPIKLLESMGCSILKSNNAVKLEAPKRLANINYIRTNPYPDFPTDLQSLYMSLMSLSLGDGVIEENVFENRFQNANQINSLGGNIKILGKQAFIHGKEKLHTGHIYGGDLRGSVGLILLASGIKGGIDVDGAQYVERGYADFENKISQLGVDIVRL